MTTERMLELILLRNIVKGWMGSKLIVNRKMYSLSKLSRRLRELEEEFLNPYVIDNAEKSE